jgi:hypothetical protein
VTPVRRPSAAAPSASPDRARSSVDELLRPAPSLGVPVPAYGGRSVPNVTSTIVQALGGEPSELALPPLTADLDPFRGGRAEGPVLLFVVDGLGWDALRAAAGPQGRPPWDDLSRPITTVFPTTTTVALTSISSAAPPSRHGVVGYRQFLPAFGCVVDMLRMAPTAGGVEDSLVGPGWSPGVVSGAPTIFRGRLSGSATISRDRFEGRGFTRMLYDGAEYSGYSGWSDFAGALADRLVAAPRPSLTVAYWDELDAVQHLRGPADPAVALEIGRLGALLGFVANAVGAGAARETTVVLTADHGLVPTEPARQIAIDAEPTILPLLARPPTGDRRVGLFQARAGCVEALREALLARFPSGTTVLDTAVAVREGLFGPPPFHPELSERLGELVVLVPSPAGITYRAPGKPPLRRALRGAHGGLEAAELIVPLTAGRLEQFRPAPRKP